jgi:hypothetical protein
LPTVKKRSACPLKVLAAAEKMRQKFEKTCPPVKSSGTALKDPPGVRKNLSTAGKVVAQLLKVCLPF